MEAMAEIGRDPEGRGRKPIAPKAKFEVARIDEIEREVKHDVIAFLTNVAEHVGPEARFAHQGMTSSDVLDTCLAVQLARASDLLIAGCERVMAALKKRALEYKMTPCIGRSHGIHAEPTTFGLKLAGHYAEFARNLERLEDGARGDRHLRHFRRGRHVRADRSAGGSICRREARPRGRAGLHASDPARPPCRVLRRAWRGRRQASSGSPPKCAICSAPKCWKRRNISSRARRAPRPCRTSAIRC